MPKGFTTCSNCGCPISSRKLRSHQAECTGATNSTIEDTIEPNKSDGEWVQVKNHPEYEMMTQYPFSIRRIDKPDRILTERVDFHGYVVVDLLKKKCKKHRLIAEQFIPNPKNLPIIDHIDNDRTNFHIENLRWTTQKQNSNNRFDQIFYDDIPGDSIVVNNYGDIEFNFLYYNEDRDEFYFFNGMNYVLRPKYVCKNGDYKINATDATGRRRNIQLNKFKREYGLD